MMLSQASSGSQPGGSVNVAPGVPPQLGQQQQQQQSQWPQQTQPSGQQSQPFDQQNSQAFVAQPTFSQQIQAKTAQAGLQQGKLLGPSSSFTQKMQAAMNQGSPSMQSPTETSTSAWPNQFSWLQGTGRTGPSIQENKEPPSTVKQRIAAFENGVRDAGSLNPASNRRLSAPGGDRRAAQILDVAKSRKGSRPTSLDNWPLSSTTDSLRFMQQKSNSRPPMASPSQQSRAVSPGVASLGVGGPKVFHGSAELPTSDGLPVRAGSVSTCGRHTPGNQSPRSTMTGATFTELESQMETMKQAIEQSKKLLNTAPTLNSSPTSKSSFAQEFASDLNNSSGDRPTSSGMRQSALFNFMCHIEEQQDRQREMISKLTLHWEQRFAALEKAVTTGLDTAAATATSMNERAGKVLRLGEALEGTADQAVSCAKDVTLLFQKVSNLEREVDKLIREMNDEKAGRLKTTNDMFLQMEGKMAALRDRPAIEHAPSMPLAQTQPAASPYAAPEPENSKDFYRPLAQEVNAMRDEVHQLTGEVARVCGTESSELSQRLRTLGNELRSDLARSSVAYESSAVEAYRRT